MKNLFVFLLSLNFLLILSLRSDIAAEDNINDSWEWNTFIGSWHTDHGNGIAVDDSSNVYVTGLSKADWGSPVNDYAGDWEVFVAKFNSNGELQWHTFLGSVDKDEGYGIAVDGSGNVYIVGGIENTAYMLLTNTDTEQVKLFKVSVNMSVSNV